MRDFKIAVFWKNNDLGYIHITQKQQILKQIENVTLDKLIENTFKFEVLSYFGTLWMWQIFKLC